MEVTMSPEAIILIMAGVFVIGVIIRFETKKY
jgi:hypothetical protein